MTATISRQPTSTALRVTFAASAIAGGLALLGTAALLAARAEFGMIGAKLLSHRKLGTVVVETAAYARVLRTGEETLATRITVYRDAVSLLLSAATVYTVAWVTQTLSV